VKRLTDDLVKEIAAKKTRATKPDVSVSWRTSSLLQTFHKPAGNRSEILRYFPIAVVATIEGYFRSRLAELIDHGEPFISNALKAYPEIKFDISMAGAITARKITIGGLITHSFGISSFSNLVKAVSNISGRPKFLEEVARIKPTALGSEKKAPIISDPVDAWARLSTVFENRHILCHELAPDVVFDNVEIRALLLATQEFTRASAIWLAKLQNPDPEKAHKESLQRITAKHEAAKASIDEMLTNAKVLSEHLQDEGVLHASVNEFQSSLNSLLSSTDKLNALLNPYHMRFREWEKMEAEMKILTIVTNDLRKAMMMGMLPNIIEREKQTRKNLRLKQDGTNISET
jgi:hypothetical protein